MTVPAASWRSRRFCAASSRLCCSFCAALIELFPASTSPAPPAFSSSSKRSVWYVRDEGGLGWGLPPPVPGLWAPLKVLALTGRMGCAGGCPAGLRESLLALRRGEGRVEIARQVVARGPLFSSSGCLLGVHGRERRARTTGDSPSMRGRNASIGHARACRGVDGPNGRVPGGERRRRGGSRQIAEKAVAKGPERPPVGRKRSASAGYAPARIRDERVGDSPHGATFVAVALYVEGILVEEHVDACEAPPRPRTTVVRPDEGARAFPMVDRWQMMTRSL